LKSTALASIAYFAALTPRMASAQDIPSMQEFYVMHGACNHLTLPGGDQTSACTTSLGHMIYKNGRSSFWFNIEGGQIIAFSGFETPGNEGGASLDVDLISTATPKAKIHSSAAKGSCSFSNPWTGPFHIRCHGQGDSGRYLAEFTSDGKPPEKIAGD
jgi:hypothetical protein